jgi:hypothetical protein
MQCSTASVSNRLSDRHEVRSRKASNPMRHFGSDPRPSATGGRGRSRTDHLTGRCALDWPKSGVRIDVLSRWDRLVERAAHRHGYVMTRDARELDIDPTQLRLMAARGRLDRAGRVIVPADCVR